MKTPHLFRINAAVLLLAAGLPFSLSGSASNVWGDHPCVAPESPTDSASKVIYYLDCALSLDNYWTQIGILNWASDSLAQISGLDTEQRVEIHDFVHTMAADHKTHFHEPIYDHAANIMKIVILFIFFLLTVIF